MKNNMQDTEQAIVVTPEGFFAHWQGHRRVTRRVIEAFPEDKLFTYSVGGMRPFGELATEIIRMSHPGIIGVQSGKWVNMDDLPAPTTKAELLKLWDETTDIINETWPKIAPERYQERDIAFGQYEGPVYWTLFYFMDNEVHHRGQGYVYLRSLGITPPAFWDRA